MTTKSGTIHAENVPAVAPAGRRARLLALGAAVWLLAASAGLTVLTRYSNVPGPASEPPGRWPTDSAIPRESGRPTLVMFAHPHCPCTRASIDELEIVLSDCPGAVACRVLLVRPHDAAPGWERSDIWASASELQDCRVLVDSDGAEARRFGAETSGAVVLYSADGALLFHGGITQSRGHSGDNAARAGVTALLHHERPACVSAPVFGCELFDVNDGNPPASRPGVGGRATLCRKRP